jgi:O-antigen/teichoic acid export membrane protein
VNVLVGTPFRMTWQWQQFDFAKKPDAKILHAKVQVYQLLVSVSVGLAIAVLAKDALRIIAPMSYWGAAQVVPIIALCYILDNVRSVIVSGVLIQRTTRSLIPIALAAAAIDIALNFILIPHFLAMGAAVATLLAYLAYLTMTLPVAQRVYFVPYEYARNIKVLGSAALIYLASILVDLSLVRSILVHLLLLALFVVVSIRLLDDDERSLLRRTGSSLVQRLRCVLQGA